MAGSNKNVKTKQLYGHLKSAAWFLRYFSLNRVRLVNLIKRTEQLKRKGKTLPIWYKGYFNLYCDLQTTQDSKVEKFILTHQTFYSETRSRCWGPEALPDCWWQTARQDRGLDSAAAAPDDQSPHHAGAPADTKWQRSLQLKNINENI